MHSVADAIKIEWWSDGMEGNPIIKYNNLININISSRFLFAAANFFLSIAGGQPLYKYQSTGHSGFGFN